MTVQKNLVKNIYVGNGSTTQFPITFDVNTEHPEYIHVYLTNDDNITTETENFTVNLTAKTVTYPKEGQPLATGKKLVIMRELPLMQLMDLINQGNYYADDVEQAFDDLTMIAQQLSEKLARAMVFSVEVDTANFSNIIPLAPGMSFRINDEGTELELTEDPAKVLPQAQDLLQQTTEQANIATNKASAAAESALSAATSESNAGAHENKAQAWAESEKSPDGEPDSKSAKTWAGDSADSAEMAQKWAESENSPDGEDDADSPTGKSMSAKQWALYAKEQASAIAAYPVGTVYISTVNKSPATIFGGTWEALPAGRVLLAQGESDWGTSYPAGSTGGEATHTLTTDEMPSHTHNITATAASVEGHEHDWYSGPYGGSQYSTSADSAGIGAETFRHKTKAAGSHSHDIEASADTAGGGNAHNNMQPYLSVYMWKRTA